MKCYTDYPLDHPNYRDFCMKEIELISYDGDKYVEFIYKNTTYTIKSGYIYTNTNCKNITKEELNEVYGKQE